MIKHTLTKKQQLVLCAMYVESLGGVNGKQDPTKQACKGGYSKQIVICLQPFFTCPQSTINYLQSYGLVGTHDAGFVDLYYCLTPSGVALAKALFKVLS